MFHKWKDVEPNQALKLLYQLKALFADQAKWISWPLAEDAKGNEIPPTDPKATRFCLMGACEMLTDQDYVLPLAWFVNCAVREYLNDLSADALIHGKTRYEDEVALIEEAILDIEKELKHEDTA